jgi:cation diffusion facilitator CzcD-associated flavoprotein CzcO
MPFPAPNTLAIIGAGPVGLEAALAALDHGFDVQVFEQGEVGSHPLAWGHVRMFTPWRMNLGKHSRAHLEATGWTAPDPEVRPTGAELAGRYLQPLAQLTELTGRIRPFTQVVQASRHGLLRGEGSDAGTRRTRPFRLLARDQGGRESFHHAFSLVDASGVYANPGWAGTGGIPARSEQYLRPQLAYHVEDVLGLDRERYAGRRTVVIGDGTFAATTVAALAQLADEAAGTTVAWVTRAIASGVFPAAEHDPLPGRRELRMRARALAAGAHPAVAHVGSAEVEEFEFNPATHRYRVILATGGETRTEEADRVIVNAGFGPDATLCRELDRDEPQFFALGHGPHGPEPDFLLETGYRQVEDAVERLADGMRASAP